MVDTCQAATLHSQLYSLGCSHNCVDRFTYYTLQFFENLEIFSNTTLQSLLQTYNPKLLDSHINYRSDLFARPLDQVLLTDFFGSVMEVEHTKSSTQMYAEFVDVNVYEPGEDDIELYKPSVNIPVNEETIADLKPSPEQGIEGLISIAGMFQSDLNNYDLPVVIGVLGLAFAVSLVSSIYPYSPFKI
ncbi:hypothetical protein MARPO_0092s0031 [Marchantia polymorpha]|uniref:GPI-anchor transamidase n=1 Tax=Marchantia polymorpha TaxID=3197 RepID=A0A2R6WGT0_MARPO|nr:hypothetical protein MARPO_0092s0031 [Marchantia polymorpha]|eukprot:PTQ33062.1 hypothetical protein MARPO_0092s0031 [Marchantia polymorpha]